jgi:hypothetical protein
MDRAARNQRAKELKATMGKPDPMTTGVQFGDAKKPIHLPDRNTLVFRDKHGAWYSKTNKRDITEFTRITDPRVERAFERESKGRIPGKKYTVRKIPDLKPGDPVVAKGLAGVFRKISDKDPMKILVEPKAGEQGQWFDRSDVRPADGVFEEMGQYFGDLGNNEMSGKIRRKAEYKLRKQMPSPKGTKLAGRVKTIREPPPTNDAERDRRVRDLLTDRRDSSDPQEKKKIRSRLRALGHTGGLNGAQGS